MDLDPLLNIICNTVIMQKDIALYVVNGFLFPKL
jgi:hypothetical protein